MTIEHSEERRRLYWHEYFVSLRIGNKDRARRFHQLARAEERKKKIAKRWNAEQFTLL